MDINKGINSDSSAQAIVKKQKLEECPHSVRCYRRNPHHFKEYDHSHLKEFLYITKPIFPETFIQNRIVYMEQLQVIRELNKVKLAIGPMETEVLQQGKLELHSQTQSLNSRGQEIAKLTSAFFNQEKQGSEASKNTDGKVLKYANTMKEKLEICSPYNLFFTKVQIAPQTLTGYNCISFPDLICPSLGTLVQSLQINFMIDVSWLIEQYHVHNVHTKPLTIIYGYDFPMMKEYIARNLPNVTAHQVKMKDPFGVHHSKIGIYKFENGDLRVVVSTANLYYEDWNHYNQALWVSPPLAKMNATKHEFECPGPTGFKTEFIKYLQSYNLGVLAEWIALVKRADFSAVRVFFVSSIPGRHYPRTSGSHVHHVGDLLSKHCDLPDSAGPSSWDINAQSSSLGTFGKSGNDWLRPVLLRALSSHKNLPLPTASNATLNLIYPTIKNVADGYLGATGAGCLPYAKSVNNKQQWLTEYLCTWKADHTGRSRIMPHIKSYVRVSPCYTQLAWCLITSANVSKAAWGGNPARDGGTYVRSYEAGVMFMPHVFGEKYFVIKRKEGDVGNLFPLMYDLPLQSYKCHDEPWCA